MPQTSIGIAQGSLHGYTMRGKEFSLIKLMCSRVQLKITLDPVIIGLFYEHNPTIKILWKLFKCV